MKFQKWQILFKSSSPRDKKTLWENFLTMCQHLLQVKPIDGKIKQCLLNKNSNYDYDSNKLSDVTVCFALPFQLQLQVDKIEVKFLNTPSITCNAVRVNGLWPPIRGSTIAR